MNLLIKALKKDERKVKAAAAEALGKIGDIRAVQPLIDALADPNTLLGRAVWHALKKFGRHAVNPLIANPHNENEDMVAYTAIILGEIGDRRAVHPLINVLNHDDPYVHTCVANALEKLGWETD